MPTLHIHSGLHKTGTTSLQKTLFDNTALLAHHGYLYPETGLSPLPNNWGHHELAYALRRPVAGREIWSALRREADASKLPNVILSSEELSLLPFHSFPGVLPYKLIAEVFEGYDIRVICYLRPQAEMAASLYNHNVKAAGETGDIMSFLARTSRRLDYAYYTNIAGVVLGHEAIVVRRYQERHMVMGDTVSDFAAQVGLDPSLLPRERAGLNFGLTDAGLQAMLEINRRYADQPEKLHAKRLKIIENNRADQFGSANSLSMEARRTITALHAQGNRLVARRYLGLDGDLFEDPELE